MNARHLAPMPEPDHVVDEIGGDGVTDWLDEIYSRGFRHGFVVGFGMCAMGAATMAVWLARGLSW